MSFAEDLAKYADKTAKRLDTVAYNATVLIFSSVVFETAIDTGRLRGGWQPSVGQGDYTVSYRLDPTGAFVIEDIQTVVVGGELNFLTNTVEYGYVLEYGLYPNPPKKGTGKTQGGFSTQTPYGMISPNLLRWNDFVQQAVALAV